MCHYGIEFIGNDILENEIEPHKKFLSIFTGQVKYFLLKQDFFLCQVKSCVNPQKYQIKSYTSKNSSLFHGTSFHTAPSESYGNFLSTPLESEAA